MSEFEREEVAFRAAFAEHATEVLGPTADTPLRMTPRPRRRWWLLSIAAAAAVVVAVVPFLLDRDTHPAAPAAPAPPAASAVDAGQWRWVAFRDVEVQVPADWDYAYPPLRPDCITTGDARDYWARDVPKAPYVSVGTDRRIVPLVGCPGRREPGDPPKEFGELPFGLWQPYVRMVDFQEEWLGPGEEAGEWTYRGWTLTRAVLYGVVVAILAPPEQPDLATRVIESARKVDRTTLGCDPHSSAQDTRFRRPASGGLPEAGSVSAVTLCDYSRADGRQGLEGSRQITGTAAQELVRAIEASPTGSGPNRPGGCLPTSYGMRSLVLVFLDESGKSISEAYVYFDWCFGNGIFTADSVHRLTRADCQPLFARPPISLFSADAVIAPVCGTG